MPRDDEIPRRRKRARPAAEGAVVGWLVIAGILLFLVLTAGTAGVLWVSGAFGPAGAGSGKGARLVGQWE